MQPPRDHARLGIALLLAALGGLGVTPAHAADPTDDLAGYTSSLLEQDIRRILDVAREGPLVTGYARTGSEASRALDGLVARTERELGLVLGMLGLTAPGKLELFVYDSAAEMAGLTGAPDPTRAVFLDGAIHMPKSAETAADAVVVALEQAWARTAKRLGGGIEGGRWHALTVKLAAGKLTVALDGRACDPVDVESGKGRVAFAVVGGRLGLRDFKLRAGPKVGWERPLRDASSLEADSPVLWTVQETGQVEAFQPSGMTRAVVRSAELTELELEASVRPSDGATLEVVVGHGSETPVRILFTPLVVAASSRKQGKAATTLLSGPTRYLREGLMEAARQKGLGRDPHVRARAAMEGGAATSHRSLLGALPKDPFEAAQKRALLGSFVLHALESRGAEAMRELYFTPVRDLGATSPFVELEASWLAGLKANAAPPAALAEARAELGFDLIGTDVLKGLTPIVIDKDKVRFGRRGTWKAEGSVQVFRGDGTGAGSLEPKIKIGAATAIRARVALYGTARVAVLLRDWEDRLATIELSAAGARILDAKKAELARSAEELPTGIPLDVVVTWDGPAARVYVGGALAVEAKSGLVFGPGFFALSVDGPRVDIHALASGKLR